MIWPLQASAIVAARARIVRKIASFILKILNRVGIAAVGTTSKKLLLKMSAEEELTFYAWGKDVLAFFKRSYAKKSIFCHFPFTMSLLKRYYSLATTHNVQFSEAVIG